jgi:hypothetical protein
MMDHKIGPVEQEMLDTVRVIEKYLPMASNKLLQRWKGVFTTAILKIEEELNSTLMHQCGVCGFEEYGYRTELPIGWREKGDLTICYNHEDNEVAELLKKAIDADKPEPVDTEKTLDELMAIL